LPAFDDLAKCAEKNRRIEELLRELGVDPEELVLYEIVAQRSGCEALESILEAQLKVKKVMDEVYEKIPVEYEIEMMKMLPIIEEVREKYESLLYRRRR